LFTDVLSPDILNISKPKRIRKINKMVAMLPQKY
jgi:hypothetical protein